MTNFLYVLAGLLSLVALIAIGFALAPRPFRAHPRPTQPGEPAPMPPGLPEPVRRHFVETLGENPPRIETAVVWGRGRACIRGVWVPFRFKGWYRPGVAFYRRLEITWFQRPILRGVDYLINGEGLFEMGGREERGPHIDQGQRLALWADAVWMPSAYVHDPHARWEAVDEHSARLVVQTPTGEADSLMAYFDPLTGRLTHFSAERYSSESQQMEPWRLDLLSWRKFNDLLIPDQTSLAWGESGSPISYWTLDGAAYNVSVDDQLG